MQLKFTSLPTKGVLYHSGDPAVEDREYTASQLRYESNVSECKEAYSDSFNYKAVDDDGAESNESIATIAATANNCAPVSTAFTKEITKTDTIDFTAYVSDHETY